MNIDLETFCQQAEEFISAHYPRRSARAGSEHAAVAVIPERSAAQEAAELPEAIQWRKTTFDAGFGWIDGPAEFGGRGLPPSYADAYRQLERRYAVPDEGYTRFSVGILCPTLLAHGGPELNGRYLRALRRADIVSCQLFSEPDAGSDLASVRTRAGRDGESGDSWRINGQKVWTSGAHYSEVGMLLARTEPGSRRNAGLSVFMIEMDQPGVEVRPIQQLTGGKSFSEVFLDDARVSAQSLVGEIGRGWDVINTTLRHERAVIGSDGAVDLALVPRLIDLARRHGCWDDPVVREATADIYARAQADSLMTLDFLDRAEGGMPGAEMSLSKLRLTDNLQRISALAQRILGGSFVTELDDDFGWSQLALTLAGLRIGGGTDEVLRTIVAQRVLSLPRS
ncbi:alkylation response protein AidB-like acyl-CoA dehydrogenase [Jatrophihabitans sp. GAS493]|uniref:acyl-CoA dehydrogenase family protein n=1 Tax=Jatrophihabitans sp. GAS493 TaxID=1907575 RepID=UPI000BB84B27|nr:acyl-CoA dehydrogenase family protein [Jatrophihabitans sp. GAS493]SOD74678.1 alkylation response protein AidB-like acyl-CoA dehydrogenase [Jatrophihabitans sp. GAS493]